ncbi:MerC domain-containing protein [Cyclobacterium sp. 1_MG-2023]|uniref:MerC domain-containing protein n=1 Tax=Cyclobacterium sp. 1_MG-2023 TaxID=3062681 RepID=UPI0026E288E6|nr:MerC domain-containing protein [Cyclobacterium sp. 1_MG-2023]MDO6437801.1 MerC domain-containing protein [Cyclobacterium sp. 1_MG-2023]
MSLTFRNSDTLGAIAGALCVVHCMATPLVFILLNCPTETCIGVAGLWSNLDYFFLFVSFIAVSRSSQNTSRDFMKPALWSSWLLLFLLILIEKNSWYLLPEMVIYVAAMLLALLHVYNLKYCKCETDKCCRKNG